MPKSNRATTLLLGVIATILLGWVLHAGADILKPIAIAFLLASMLQPIVIGLARRGIPPALTVILMVWLLFLGLVQAGLLLEANIQAFFQGTTAVVEPITPDTGEIQPADVKVPEEEAPIEDLADTDGEETAGDEEGAVDGEGSEGEEGETDETPRKDPLAKGQEELMAEAGGWPAIVDGISQRLRESEIPENVITYVEGSLTRLEPEAIAGDLAIGGLGFITTLMLVMIYMVFIFAEQAVFRRKILAIAGDRRDEAANVLDTIGRGIQRYLGVKTVVSLLTGSLCYLALVWLEIPYALLFGFVTFLLNYIPTFGSIIAGIFPTITAVAFEASWAKALIVIVVYLSVNLTLGSFIEPRILGRELNLSPLVVVISVVVWSGLWGVVGGFLAVPLTAGMQICLASNETTRPVAIMLGSGPPREKKKKRRKSGEGSEDPSSEAA